MKKIMVLLVVALFISPLLFCVPKAGAAANWKQLKQNKYMSVYYDANSIQRSGDVVRVTLLEKLTPAGYKLFPLEASRKVDHTLQLMEINCKNKTEVIKRTISYRADGSKESDILNDDPDMPDYEPSDIRPGSREDTLYQIVCRF